MQSRSSAPAIDPAALAEIREMAGDEPTLVPQIIDCYLQESPILIATIQAAVSQQNALDLMRAAHSLKSSSQSLGAIELAKLCLLLEQIGRSSQIEDRIEEISAAMKQLESEYKRVELALLQERDRV